MSLSYGLCLGPTNTKYTAEQFSRALHHAAGDGVCQWGSRFAAELSGFQLSLGSGFAIAGGHWLKNDAPLALAVPPAYNHRDRTDLAAVQVDHQARQASLVLLEDADLDALPQEPLTMPLYALRVQRGAVDLLPSDVTDLRRNIPPLSSLTPEGLRAVAFVRGGLDQEVARILGLWDLVIAKGQRAVEELDRAIDNAGGMPVIGGMLVSRRLPQPLGQWVRCDGGVIPPEYSQLRALVGDRAPSLAFPDPRFHAYLFGGEPDPPSLWVKIADPSEAWPPWSQPIGAMDAYPLGARVRHKGEHWTSAVENNVWEPGVFGWEAESNG